MERIREYERTKRITDDFPIGSNISYLLPTKKKSARTTANCDPPTTTSFFLLLTSARALLLKRRYNGRGVEQILVGLVAQNQTVVD